MVVKSRAEGQGRAGSLMLGLNSSVSAGNLRATMLAWSSDNPEVDLESVEGDRGALLAALNSGEIDIAVLLGGARQNGFRSEIFWSERILVALPTDHPFASRELVHWTDLWTQRFALPAADPGPDIRDMLLGRMSMSAATRDIRMHRTSRETVLSLLSEWGYASLVCEGSTGTRYPDVVYRPIHGEQGPALITFSGYWRDDNRNPPLRRFLEFVRQRYALSFDLFDCQAQAGQRTT